MIFSTKAEYGIRILIQLGLQAGRPVSLSEVAETEQLPLAYLERIVAMLKRADLVVSTRGARGGYQLATQPSDITMDKVVLALEGPVEPMECFAPSGGKHRVWCSHLSDPNACATKMLWTRVQLAVNETLAQTTLAQLINFATQTTNVGGRATQFATIGTNSQHRQPQMETNG